MHQEPHPNSHRVGAITPAHEQLGSQFGRLGLPCPHIADALRPTLRGGPTEWVAGRPPSGQFEGRPSHVGAGIHWRYGSDGPFVAVSLDTIAADRTRISYAALYGPLSVWVEGTHSEVVDRNYVGEALLVVADLIARAEAYGLHDYPEPDMQVVCVTDDDGRPWSTYWTVPNEHPTDLVTDDSIHVIHGEVRQALLCAAGW